MKNARFEECKAIVTEALDRVYESSDGEFEKIDVTDELIYNIFGDDLDVENSVEEVMWMFMMEL